MGKFNEYTQKATPADNDTLMIYDATSKSNKLSPFSGIWNWIVGKLTNAVISNLQTNNQTMIGAINELNSNKVSYSEYVTINPSNGFSTVLDNKSTYLICYAGINSDNIRNIGFSIVISRRSNAKSGGVLNIKSELNNVTLELDGNVFKITTSVWMVASIIKL